MSATFCPYTRGCPYGHCTEPDKQCETHYGTDGQIKLHVRSDGAHEYFDNGRISLVEMSNGYEIHYNKDGSVHAVILPDGSRQFFEKSRLKLAVNLDGSEIRYSDTGLIESIKLPCGHVMYPTAKSCK